MDGPNCGDWAPVQINQTFATDERSSLDMFKGDFRMSRSEQHPDFKQGPHSSEHADDQADLGFDPDSPDLEDPQVDPQGPAKPPRDHEKEG